MAVFISRAFNRNKDVTSRKTVLPALLASSIQPGCEEPAGERRGTPLFMAAMLSWGGAAAPWGAPGAPCRSAAGCLAAPAPLGVPTQRMRFPTGPQGVKAAVPYPTPSAPPLAQALFCRQGQRSGELAFPGVWSPEPQPHSTSPALSPHQGFSSQDTCASRSVNPAMRTRQVGTTAQAQGGTWLDLGPPCRVGLQGASPAPPAGQAGAGGGAERARQALPPYPPTRLCPHSPARRPRGLLAQSPAGVTWRTEGRAPRPPRDATAVGQPS